jgi:signal transduction histidine kinase
LNCSTSSASRWGCFAGDEIGRVAELHLRAEALLASRAVELTKARDEAVQASQAKNTFLSSTSHELRTPLNSILGFTQLLQLSELSDEDSDSVERILGAGRHLLVLINELIDIARRRRSRAPGSGCPWPEPSLRPCAAG